MKSLRPSPSHPAVPPPNSPRSPALQRGAFADGGGGKPNQAAAAQPAMAGKQNVIPYAQYRKSRLDSIRSLSGARPRGSLLYRQADHTTSARRVRVARSECLLTWEQGEVAI
jgi:hypothetical protein